MRQFRGIFKGESRESMGFQPLAAVGFNMEDGF